MRAGFAKVCVTPPLGTQMMGVGARDTAHGCEAIRDDIFVRALFVEHGGEAALIMCFDFCFVGRDDADRWKGVLGREFEMLPRQIMLTTTHSHVSPAVGAWYAGDFHIPDRVYLQQLEAAVVKAARVARDSAVEATLWTGMAHSKLPMNRRRRVNGETENAPNPDGPVCDVLPLCLIKNRDNEPIALLFSIATHPSIVRGWEISGEFPGFACDRIDAQLGESCSLFLQGTAGDSKPYVIATPDNEWKWDAGWSEAEEVAAILAQEVLEGLEAGLQPVEPEVHSALLDTAWPLGTPHSREEWEAIAGEESNDPIFRGWASRQLTALKHHGLATAVPVLFQGIQLGKGLRLIAIEGEPVSHYGHMILEAYPDGVTFPLGYANGESMYLVTSEMLDEGGMEPTSYWEFGWPAPLAKGMEKVAAEAIQELRARGIN
jgi:hypothetical protein